MSFFCNIFVKIKNIFLICKNKRLRTYIDCRKNGFIYVVNYFSSCMQNAQKMNGVFVCYGNYVFDEFSIGVFYLTNYYYGEKEEIKL